MSIFLSMYFELSDKTSNTIYVAPRRSNKFCISTFLSLFSTFSIIFFKIFNSVSTVDLHLSSLKARYKKYINFLEMDLTSGFIVTAFANCGLSNFLIFIIAFAIVSLSISCYYSNVSFPTN